MLKRIILLLALCLVCAACDTQQHTVKPEELDISSPAIGGPVPTKFTCNGADVNPPLTLGDIPGATESLSLVMTDPDAPQGTWVHWVVFNIPPDKNIIQENSTPGIQGTNDFDRIGYNGPCPPAGETHRYIFKAYALDTNVTLAEGAKKSQLHSAMQGHILARGTLAAKYEG